MSAELKIFSGEPAPVETDAPHPWARISRLALSDETLTDPERVVLATLASFDRGEGTKATDREIGAACDKSRVTINRLVGQLVTKGYVLRVTTISSRSLRISHDFLGRLDRSTGPKTLEPGVSQPCDRGVSTSRHGVSQPCDRGVSTLRHSFLDSLETEKDSSQNAGVSIHRPVEGPESTPRKPGDFERPAPSSPTNATVPTAKNPAGRSRCVPPTAGQPAAPLAPEPSDVLNPENVDYWTERLNHPDRSFRGIAEMVLRKHNAALEFVNAGGVFEAVEPRSREEPGVVVSRQTPNHARLKSPIP